MTSGELAIMVNREKWLRGGIPVDLEVVPVAGYNREIWYDQTGLSWVNPSPNVRSMEAIVVYPGIALLEGTNISEGRGTGSPFLLVGAPFVNGVELEAYLNEKELPGVTFEKTVFIPESSGHIKGAPKYSNMHCEGVKVHITDRDKIKPVELGLLIITAIRSLYPGKLRFREPWFDRLIGAGNVRLLIEKGLNAAEISTIWSDETSGFRQVSKQYYLYKNSEAVVASNEITNK